MAISDITGIFLMMKATIFLLAVVATVAFTTPAFAMDGNRGMPCADDVGLEKIKCRIEMVKDRIDIMKDRHSANNDENTPQEILDLQKVQKNRAENVEELLEQSKLAKIIQDRKDLIVKMSVILGDLEGGCDKLHELWQAYRGR